jgi:hypothetical protein
MSVCEDGIVHFILDFATVSVNRKKIFEAENPNFSSGSTDSFVRYLENYCAFLA